MHRISPRVAHRISPRILWIPLLCFASLGVAAPRGAPAAPDPHASYAPKALRAERVLSHRASARLEREGRSALWVYFTDKGETDSRSFARAVRDAGARVGERARARRTRETGGRFVPDYYDVAVPARYVDAVASTGATVRKISRWLNAVSVEADRATALRLAGLPFVRVIEPLAVSRRVEPLGGVTPIPSAPLPGLEQQGVFSPRPRGTTYLAPALGPPGSYGSSLTQLNGISAKTAQDSGYTGAGVIIAMFDTGFNKAHNATTLLKRIAEHDFVFNDGETANEAADDGNAWDHGTGTWSVAGGYYSGSLIGPAYNATFVLAKTEDIRSETPVEEDNWMAAVEWADSIGADVISSSLAYFTFDTPSDNYQYSDLNGQTAVTTLAALLAARRGIVVANAMGNSGPNLETLNAPADADSILSVGAVDASNVIAGFSSRGPTYDGRGKPEVVAQGVSTTWAVASSNTLVAQANGTSLATPLIGGAAAQVREAHPEWSVQEIRYALKVSGDKSSSPDSSTYGWGRPNVVSAIYSTLLGGPIFPKPFDLLLPVHQAVIGTGSVEFKWRRSRDPNGDAVTYRLIVNKKKSPADSTILDTTTSDTTATYLGYLGPLQNYEWFVTAKDPANHERECRGRFLFATDTITGVEGGESPSASVTLYQNRPNPLRSATRIPFAISGSAGTGSVVLSLRIFDASGRLVRTLAENATRSVPGVSLEDWDGKDEKGRRVGSGIYYYRLSLGGKEYSRRMVVLR